MNSCSPAVCSFIPGPWSPCSATCGPGRQTREVKCRVLLPFTQTEVDLPDEECGDDTPQLQRPCNQEQCNSVPGISADLQDQGDLYMQQVEVHSWDYRGFTKCSATCAAGEASDMFRLTSSMHVVVLCPPGCSACPLSRKADSSGEVC